MPVLSRSRLDEIRSLAGEVTASMAGGGNGKGLLEKLGLLAAAVGEVNAALAEIDEFLLAGLRDEAVSMHDPELVTVARLLDLRSRPDWVPLHGWLLERGQPPPAAVNLEAAEQFAAAIQEVDALRDDLNRLRRLALERAAIGPRLELLRRLRTADPASQVWIDAVAAHEEARIRELRLAVPQAVAAGDIEALAALAGELADPDWDQRPPADLAPQVAGGVEAGTLVRTATEAETIAAELDRAMAGEGPASPREIDAASGQRQRLDELVSRADQLLGAIEPYPRMLAIVRARGLDRAVRRTADAAAAALGRIERLAATLQTKRDFEAARQRLEYLCDHPPQQGAESRWLADLQRCDVVARSACQELPELSLPPLLRERVQRAVAAVESREQLRRRFWVVTAAGVVAGLVVVTAAAGWFTWRRGEYARTVSELKRRVAEARAGLHLERPEAIDRFVGRYAGDATVTNLVEDFEVGVTAEKQRARTFRDRLADHGERLEELAVEVADRRAAGEDVWLEAWPPSFPAAVAALAAARQSGGLPDRRGGDAAVEEVTLSAEARQRFQAEEDDLAKAESRQADLERNLARLAQEAFDARLARVQDGLAGDPDAADLGRLLDDARTLRRLATAVRAEGLPAAAAGQRVPAEAVATLDTLVTRMQQLAREAGESKGGSR